MEPCLIIFDIDETLYINHEGRIPKSTLEAITKLKKAGHTLAIATGRTLFELIDEAKQLPADFFILANGQLIVQNDEIIYENSIDIDIINEIMAEAKKNGVHVGFNSTSHSSVTGLSDEQAIEFAKYYSVLPEISENINNHGAIHQMWYLSEDIADIAKKFKNRLRFIPWLTNGADVIPIGVSKAAGLEKALEILKDILPKKIIFFGDGINDIELMEKADIGIAMGNAVPSLKLIADFVTKNIEDDGIYHACEQLGLFEKTLSDDDEIKAMISQLETTIAIEPNILDNYFKLKSLYSSYTRESKKALNILKDALVYFPNHVKLLVELATVCEFELEDYAQAVMYYKMILAIDSEHELAIDALDVLTDKNIHPDL